MTLRNRWLVRVANGYTYGPGCLYCVDCRATNAVAFYGTKAQCRAKAKEMNSPA